VAQRGLNADGRSDRLLAVQVPNSHAIAGGEITPRELYVLERPLRPAGARVLAADAAWA
jgi:hypothetical protein